MSTQKMIKQVAKASKHVPSIAGSIYRCRIPHITNSNSRVDVLVTSQEVAINSWVQSNVLKNNKFSRSKKSAAVGLDIEWRPNFKNSRMPPTAILQMSTSSSVLIAKIKHYKRLPSTLEHVLESPKYLKMGVSISNDLKKLNEDFKLVSKGYLDLSKATQRHYGKELSLDSNNYSLFRLAKNLLNIELSKPKQIQMSNWEAYELTNKQIEYAANDAFIASLIYDKLCEDKAFDEGNMTTYYKDLIDWLYLNVQISPLKIGFAKYYNMLSESDTYNDKYSDMIDSRIRMWDDKTFKEKKAQSITNTDKISPTYLEIASLWASRIGMTITIKQSKSERSKTSNDFTYFLQNGATILAIGSGKDRNTSVEAAATAFCEEFLDLQRKSKNLLKIYATSTNTCIPEEFNLYETSKSTETKVESKL